MVYPKLESFSSAVPPLESDLLQNTLWPEAQKLYGHGNPLFCVASSVDGQLLASACKAAKPDEAAIFLWGGAARQWRVLGTIEGAHTLTITQMAFSKTDASETSSSSSSSSSSHSKTKYRLLSVSRDRTIVVTQISLPSSSDDDSIVTQILFRTNKSNGVHARIIWSCDWAHDDAFFVTASRDKKLVAWVEGGGGGRESGGGDDDVSADFRSSTPAILPDACTAVACAPRLVSLSSSSSSSSSSPYLVAIGLDNGGIHLVLFDITSKLFSELYRIPSNLGHHLTVRRLRFRPAVGRAENKTDEADLTLQLASGGSDGFLRVFEVVDA